MPRDADGKVRGTVTLEVTVKCPGGAGITRKYTVEVHSDQPGWRDDAESDLDGDGLTGAQEKKLGSNPAIYDTDGDGVEDGKDAFPRDPKKS